jgi:hypothetical protein
MDRPMGQVRSLDQMVNQAGYLRLATCEPYVKHLGNKLESHRKVDPLRNVSKKSSWGKQFLNTPLIKRSLLGIYDLIFKLYYEK